MDVWRDVAERLRRSAHIVTALFFGLFAGSACFMVFALGRVVFTEPDVELWARVIMLLMLFLLVVPFCLFCLYTVYNTLSRGLFPHHCPAARRLRRSLGGEAKGQTNRQLFTHMEEEARRGIGFGPDCVVGPEYLLMNYAAIRYRRIARLQVGRAQQQGTLVIVHHKNGKRYHCHVAPVRLEEFLETVQQSTMGRFPGPATGRRAAANAVLDRH